MAVQGKCKNYDRFHALLWAVDHVEAGVDAQLEVAVEAQAEGHDGEARFSDKEDIVLARLVEEHREGAEDGGKRIKLEIWERICKDFYVETGSYYRDRIQIRKRYSSMKNTRAGKAKVDAAKAVRCWEESAPEALLLLAGGSIEHASGSDGLTEQDLTCRKLNK